MQAILPTRADHALHSVAQTRAIEQAALALQPRPPLMERAGEALARLAMALAPHAQRVWIAAGPGNNGGDGLEAALHLRRSGREVDVTLCAAANPSPDAQSALQRAQAAGVSIRVGATASQAALDANDLAIDALLGIGASRAPDGAIAATIRALNASPCPVLAAEAGRFWNTHICATVPSTVDASKSVHPMSTKAAGRGWRGRRTTAIRIPIRYISKMGNCVMSMPQKGVSAEFDMCG